MQEAGSKKHKAVPAHWDRGQGVGVVSMSMLNAHGYG